ncbi:hypothetical protein KSP40_PGU012373 [Platanthera guangdongensis]|uniref:Uncharacterized protein n=1 Tax=Platanthera guangdongensis TaxID=2320717 RepID=A0ABR2N5K2_9ASPA
MAPSSSSSPIPFGESPEEEEGNNEKEVEKALEMDGNIPSGSGEFLRRVSSRAYDMRRNLLHTIEKRALGRNPNPFLIE